jgi:hypothetical protein
VFHRAYIYLGNFAIIFRYKLGSQVGITGGARVGVDLIDEFNDDGNKIYHTILLILHGEGQGADYHNMNVVISLTYDVGEDIVTRLGRAAIMGVLALGKKNE